MTAFQKHIERRRLRRIMKALEHMAATVTRMGPCHIEVVSTFHIPVRAQ
jgi:hypothetical protein